jgi:hypothetical protein
MEKQSTKIQFEIVYSDFMGKSITLDVKDINHKKDFNFSLIEKCYTPECPEVEEALEFTGAGYGLQVSEDMDEEKVKKMCYKISEAIFEYYKE